MIGKVLDTVGRVDYDGRMTTTQRYTVFTTTQRTDRGIGTAYKVLDTVTGELTDSMPVAKARAEVRRRNAAAIPTDPFEGIENA